MVLEQFLGSSYMTIIHKFIVYNGIRPIWVIQDVPKKEDESITPLFIGRF
jgi:hypothetical protein